MQIKKLRNTKMGTSFLFLFGIFLFIKTEPKLFPDSARYFLGENNSIWQEMIAHTGRNIQTVLFSFGSEITNDNGNGALIANISIWLLSAVSLLYFIDKNLDNSRSKNLYMTLVVILYTSYIVAAWISTVLSESIAISFLIPTLIISLLTIFNEIKIEQAKNWIVSYHVLLFFSQPIWGILLLVFTFFALGNIKKYLRHSIILAVAVAGSMSIATASHALQYENTGLTYKGFESLTRAYFFSLDGRFGNVALGENIKNCPAAYELLGQAQTKGSPQPLFVGFKDASASCPELIAELNSGKTNSIPKLLTENIKSTLRMTTVALYAFGNQEPLAGDTLSGRAIGRLSMDLFIPFGLFAFPASIILVKNKVLKIKVLLSVMWVVIGGLLLYFQVGIEGERHSFPAAMIIGVTSWLIFINGHLATKQIN